ncbi:MAG: DUF2249 domain-containing protein [Chthoniobacteraceae bacterium]
MAATIVTLDVREGLCAGREPFPRIMEAVGRLRDGEQLRIIAPFAPRPLIGVLAAQGLVGTVTEREGGSFGALFASADSAEPDGDSLL